MTVSELALKAQSPAVTGRLRAPGPPRRPRTKHGERQLERLLRSRGESPLFEPWVYPLGSGVSFRPDFWLPETGRHPEFHLEVTFLDYALADRNARLAALTGDSSTIRRRRAELMAEMRQLTRRWTDKQRRVAETERRYGLPVILVPYAVWRGVMDHPDLLDDLMPREQLAPPARLLALASA